MSVWYKCIMNLAYWGKASRNREKTKMGSVQWTLCSRVKESGAYFGLALWKLWVPLKPYIFWMLKWSCNLLGAVYQNLWEIPNCNHWVSSGPVVQHDCLGVTISTHPSLLFKNATWRWQWALPVTAIVNCLFICQTYCQCQWVCEGYYCAPPQRYRSRWGGVFSI